MGGAETRYLGDLGEEVRDVLQPHGEVELGYDLVFVEPRSWDVVSYLKCNDLLTLCDLIYNYMYNLIN